jgi:hypothetical protein
VLVTPRMTTFAPHAAPDVVASCEERSASSTESVYATYVLPGELAVKILSALTRIDRSLLTVVGGLVPQVPDVQVSVDMLNSLTAAVLVAVIYAVVRYGPLSVVLASNGKVAFVTAGLLALSCSVQVAPVSVDFQTWMAVSCVTA